MFFSFLNINFELLEFVSYLCTFLKTKTPGL